MDLLHNRRHAAANVLLNRYLTTQPGRKSGCGLAALPLFLSIRAAVRAKVLYDRLTRSDERSDKAAAAETAHALPRTGLPIDRAAGCPHWSPSAVSPAPANPVLARALAALSRAAAGSRGAAFGCRSQAAISGPGNRSAAAARLSIGSHRTGLPSPGATRGGCAFAGAFRGRGRGVWPANPSGPPSATSRIAPRTISCMFIGLLSCGRSCHQNAARVGQRQGDASDATPEVARLQEEYDIGTVDWANIDASGTPEQTLENGAKAELVRLRAARPCDEAPTAMSFS